MTVLGRTVRTHRIAACALAMVAVLVVGALAGCSSGGAAGSGTTTTKSGTVSTAKTAVSTGTTAKAGASTTRTSTTSMIVGDKTKEQYQAALPDLEAKVKAAPSDLTALLDLAVAYYNLDRFQDAASLYEQMLKLGEDPKLRNNYGNMLRDLGKVEEAKAAYLKALEGDPTLVVAYVNLAGLLVTEGKKDEAFKVLDDAIAKLQGEDKTRLENVKTALQKAK